MRNFINLADIDKRELRKIIDHAKLQKEKKCHTFCGVYRQQHNPYFNMMEINSQGFLTISKKLSIRPRTRQESPKVYQLNGLFTYDARKFLKIGDPIMKNALPYEIPFETGLMIDTEYEFNIAKLVLENKKKH